MAEEDLLIEEDDNSISSDEVSEFLKEHESSEATNVGEIPEDIQELLKEDDSKHKQEETRTTFEPDHTFEDNKKALFENMIVSVRDAEVPVTEEDKAVYLKALLTSTPVELTVVAKNGVSAKCRTISVYEADVAAGALTLYLKHYPETSYAFQDSILQQYRVALQLISFCGRDIGNLSYERGVNGTKEDHIKDLYEQSQKVLDVPGPVYGMYVRLTNVFQYKINKLQEAAFNSDFWLPAGTD